MVKLTATRHATRRARQRVGWPARSLDRMLERIFYDGLGPDECPRDLRAYLSSGIGARALCRLYGEHQFYYTRDQPDEIVRLTVYPLPARWRAAARCARENQQAWAA